MHADARLASHPAFRVGAVVVFYHPDAACIERANRLAQQCTCVVVDNTPAAAGEAAPAGLASSVHYLPNGANVGIATALNQGIAWLLSAGCDAALLFDQDSEPDTRLITEMPALMFAPAASAISATSATSAHTAESAAPSPAATAPIALIGPAYEDARLGGVAPFVRFGRWGIRRIRPEGDRVLDVDFLITSGSCINLRTWFAVGPMDDALFIDFVDLEWCARARATGHRVVGAPWLRMQHELGDTPIRIFGRAYPMHGPVRHYYAFRNATALFKRRYIPLGWKLSEMIKLPVRLVIYALFIPQGWTHVRLSLHGVSDGLRGRLGPIGAAASAAYAAAESARSRAAGQRQPRKESRRGTHRGP